MASKTVWTQLQHFTKADFSYPDKLNDYLLIQLDRLVSRLGVKPIVLSDWRPVDPSNPDSQHPEGLAVDVAFPGEDTLDMWNRILAQKKFRGIGVYTNENGAESFHLDVRWGGSVEKPALWGAFITPVVVNGQEQRVRNYTTADDVLSAISARSIPLVGMLALAGVAAWYLLKR